MRFFFPNHNPLVVDLWCSFYPSFVSVIFTNKTLRPHRVCWVPPFPGFLISPLVPLEGHAAAPPFFFPFTSPFPPRLRVRAGFAKRVQVRLWFVFPSPESLMCLSALFPRGDFFPRPVHCPYPFHPPHTLAATTCFCFRPVLSFFSPLLECLFDSQVPRPFSSGLLAFTRFRFCNGPLFTLPRSRFFRVDRFSYPPVFSCDELLGPPPLSFLGRLVGCLAYSSGPGGSPKLLLF